MKIKHFDNFLTYILNVRFTDQRIPGNQNLLYADSLIKMMYEIHNNYVGVKDELIDLKAIVENDSKDIFNAEIDRLLNKLEILDFGFNYDISKIKHWLKEFSITKSIFFTWHDVIPENNDLYLILDTHISWVEMEPDPNIYLFLNRIDSYDAQEIHRIFESFIKDHYVNKTIDLLERLKFSISNINTYSYPYFFKDQIIFNYFKSYREGHIIDPYIDYSFLFQKMLDKQFIKNISHKYFMEWLKDNNYISENILDEFLNKENFRTLEKSFSNQRDNNFNNIFKPYTTP